MLEDLKGRGGKSEEVLVALDELLNLIPAFLWVDLEQEVRAIHFDDLDIGIVTANKINCLLWNQIIVSSPEIENRDFAISEVF